MGYPREYKPSSLVKEREKRKNAGKTYYVGTMTTSKSHFDIDEDQLTLDLKLQLEVVPAYVRKQNRCLILKVKMPTYIDEKVTGDILYTWNEKKQVWKLHPDFDHADNDD